MSSISAYTILITTSWGSGLYKELNHLRIQGCSVLFLRRLLIDSEQNRRKIRATFSILVNKWRGFVMGDFIVTSWILLTPY